MNVSRPFDVYHHAAATYTRCSTTRLCNALDLGCWQANPRSSTLYSASWLPTLLQAGTPLGLRAFRAFPPPNATHDSSPQAALHAVYPEPHRSDARAAAARGWASSESVSFPAAVKRL